VHGWIFGILFYFIEGFTVSMYALTLFSKRRKNRKFQIWAKLHVVRFCFYFSKLQNFWFQIFIKFWKST
jgi:hypothetical protein